MAFPTKTVVQNWRKADGTRRGDSSSFLIEYREARRGPSNQAGCENPSSGPRPSVQHCSWGGRGGIAFPGAQPHVEELSDGPRKSFGREGLLQKTGGAFLKSRMEADIVDIAGDEENF